MKRRTFLRTVAAGGAALATGCGDIFSRGISLELATLRARPGKPTRSVPRGFTALGLSSVRDGLLYVPPAYAPDTPAPLLVLLHGGGQSSDEWRSIRIETFVDQHGVIVLAPSSRSATWEVTGARPFGDDARFIDDALAHTFERCNVHPDRIGIGGFSDGASEALSLGITNGNFFRELLVLSPGLMRPAVVRGRPQVFLAHGVDDPTISVDRSRSVVQPWLVGNGYPVTYTEFTGGHAMHGPTMRAAISWLANA